MGNFSKNKQLRTFHQNFTMQRDHKVGDAIRKGSGNLGGWYECPTCGEMVDRAGRGFRHQPKYIGK